MTRFVAQTFIVADLKYARCPDCYRMDLNGWTGKTYIPLGWMRIKIMLGATRLRCEYCRKNFASFRKRKEVFTFKRWMNTNAAKLRADGRARVKELQGHRKAAGAVPAERTEPDPVE